MKIFSQVVGFQRNARRDLKEPAVIIILPEREIADVEIVVAPGRKAPSRIFVWQ